MIKLHGFGGTTGFWDHNLESFTLMAGLAAVTSRIQLFATCATLTMPPPITARMASTIDSISHGRFGVNIITGWQGRNSADGHVARRRLNDTATTTAPNTSDHERAVGDRRSDLKGDFFQMDDCRCCPRPPATSRSSAPPRATPASRYTAQHADYNFCSGYGINTPTACATGRAHEGAAPRRPAARWPPAACSW